MSKKNLPTLSELTKDVELAHKLDEFGALMNHNPPQKWVQVHPYINGYNYLPIDKIEHLLKRIFKSYRIEVTGQGDSFNGVWVSVRVHYQHPVTGEWSYHDGIGATELQTAKGKSAADLSNINNGALAMAYPLAKTRAVKDACDHFGKLFGADLNRKDTLAYETDPNLAKNQPVSGEDWEMLKEAVKLERMTVEKANELYNLSGDQKSELWKLENK